MTKYLQINVPLPCHEGWENMTPADRGRFCNSCQKTVIDFSMMTDPQLLEFFSTHKQNVCGRFDTYQLERPIPIPVKRIPWLTYFFRITIPAFLFTAKATAQEIFKPAIEQVQLGPVLKNQEPGLPLQISGSITDSTGNPVAFASVAIKETNTGVQADADGRFSLKLNPGYNALIVSSVGYETREVMLSGDNDLSIILTESKTLLEGMVITCDYGKRSERIRLGGAMSSVVVNYIPGEEKNDLSLYPNAISYNQVLTIRWDKPVSGKQSIEIYTFSGSLMQKEMLRIKPASAEASFRVKLHSPGIYVVKVKDMKSGRMMAKQLVVE